MPPPRRSVRLTLLALATCCALSSPLSAEPVRLAGRAFDERAVIEVRDLPRERGEALIREAFGLIAELERMTGRIDGTVAELNRQAGSGPHPAPAPLRELLGKAADFCFWSAGAHGPLGGQLYDLWGRGRALPAPPDPTALSAALETASCDRMRIDNEAGTVELAPGSALDLHPFAAGAAVDLAVAHLQSGGSSNAWVRIGLVQRGIGAGPAGRGWLAQLDDLVVESTPLANLHLVDRALTVARSDGRPLRIADERLAPYIDQRARRTAPISSSPGHPQTGVLAVAVVTELAVDAQGLAGAMFIAGSFEGQFRLGSLRPAPAVLWLLGGSDGEPLVTSSHWSLAQQ